MKNIWILCALLLLVGCASTSTSNYNQEIHCRHFYYGYPTGTPQSNDMIIREIYGLSSNDDTKMADWVAYYLDKESFSRRVKTKRKWQADPWLDDSERLEPEDFRGAYQQIHTDKGHQAPLASFRSTGHWQDTNYMTNITAQKSELNQGPWRLLEEAVRDLAARNDGIYVFTGPLYEREMEKLPQADEPATVPSGYWKIIILPNAEPDQIRTAAFIFDQNTKRKAYYLDEQFIVSIDEIEKRSGLDFLNQLSEETQSKIEAEANPTFVRTLLGK